jgi:HSP20 family molecular chaperone IbpA
LAKLERVEPRVSEGADGGQDDEEVHKDQVEMDTKASRGGDESEEEQDDESEEEEDDESEEEEDDESGGEEDDEEPEETQEDTKALAALRRRLPRWEPRIRQRQSASAVQLLVDLPGVRREDINIELHRRNRTLIISGHKEASFEDAFTSMFFGATQPRRSGAWFEKEIELPHSLSMDNIAYSYDENLLKIRIPRIVTQRRPATAKARRWPGSMPDRSYSSSHRCAPLHPFHRSPSFHRTPSPFLS